MKEITADNLPEPNVMVLVSVGENLEKMPAMRIIDEAYPDGWYWYVQGAKVTDTATIKYFCEYDEKLLEEPEEVESPVEDTSHYEKDYMDK